MRVMPIFVGSPDVARADRIRCRLCGGGDGCACGGGAPAGGRRVGLGGHEGLVVDGWHAARASERWEARGPEQVGLES